jgi:autotransporter-associated beta strand protein
MQVTGYTAAANDRFTSGFPAAPVDNANANFVGLGRSWTGVGWSTGEPTKGFGFLSPSHYLVARHFQGAPTVSVAVSGSVRSASQLKVENTGLGLIFNGETIGDLSVGTLSTRLSGLSRYGVLDLNPSSSFNDPANYVGQSLLLYGRGPNGTTSPRIAATLLSSANSSVIGQYFLTGNSVAELESGDSGSPNFVAWTNPNGTPEAALVGNNAAVNPTTNFHNFLGSFEAMNSLNALLVDDGRALRVVGNPAYTWSGASSNVLVRNVAWGLNGNPTATGVTHDLFVLFHGATAANRTVSVSTSGTLRGLYFKSTGTGGDGFAFTGSAAVTVGRGGLTNYDADAQSFTANVVLGDHQYWDGGPGGLAVANLLTNGKLLEVRAGGGVTVSGTVSGAGGLAVDSGLVVLSGTSTFTGTTWVHDGELRVTGAMENSAGIVLTGTLSGSGRLPVLTAGGVVDPGTGRAILTAPSLTPQNGLRLALEFSGTMPVFASAAASGNDVLRLSGATPFAAAFGPAQTVAVYCDVADFSAGRVYRGGIFTDQPADFLPQVANATVAIFLRDAAGSVTYNGQSYRPLDATLQVEMTTEAQSADFGSGPISGRTLQFLVRPGAETYATWEVKVFPETVPAADRDADADPNGDGLSNLLAYAWRLDPLQTDPAGRPVRILEPAGPGSSELVLRFRRNRTASDLTYAVEVADDLSGPWSPFAGALTVWDANPDGDFGADWVEARIPVAAGDPKKFVRVAVTAAAP